MKNLQDIANNLLSYCGKQFKWEKPPKLFFEDDPDNAKNLLGKTAYYDPEKAEITVFITIAIQKIFCGQFHTKRCTTCKI